MRILYALLALTLLACGTAAAQNASIAGVWQAREGTPSGDRYWVYSSDVQTLFLSPDGQYQRKIVAEGGNGVWGAAGTIIDSGTYSFSAPETFQYRRSSYVICTAGGCMPGQPGGANTGTLPFTLVGQGQAIFLQLRWTKVR